MEKETRGRKPDKVPSFEVRFQMPGRYKKQLEKYADKMQTNNNEYVRIILIQDLEK